MQEKEKILLHHCCAPCSPKVIEKLAQAYEVVSFWYNPNIYPVKEHDLRKESLKNLLKTRKIELVEGLSDAHSFWHDKVKDGINKRCQACYLLRLNETAKTASFAGINKFATTLLSSPHQKHDQIREAGIAAGKQNKVEFVYIDFRPEYWQGKDIAYKNGSYMQKYCGCIFSLRERKKRVKPDRVSKP